MCVLVGAGHRKGYRPRPRAHAQSREARKLRAKKILAATGQFAARLEDFLGPLSPLSHSEAPSSHLSLAPPSLSRISLCAPNPKEFVARTQRLGRRHFRSYRLRQGQCTGYHGYVKCETCDGGKIAQKSVSGRSEGKPRDSGGHLRRNAHHPVPKLCRIGV